MPTTQTRLSSGEKVEVLTDPVVSANAAGLRYVTDTRPGIRRARKGKTFSYIGADGRTIRDANVLARIKSLAIPPAWTDVWICPAPNGHLQASGRDAKGRKQYRYHARWRQMRDETKYDRMVAFAHALPAIRAQVERDLAVPGLPKRKVLAAVVRLLEATLIRIGNEEYARMNGSFGLTTMQDRHVDVKGATLRFQFKGKAGKQHRVSVSDRRLARVVSHCRDLPGYELFQYIDDEGQPQTIDSADVNDYLREIAGEEFTAKDFRTWAGTVLAALALQGVEKVASKAEARRMVVRAIESVAAQLGNTPAICRKSYVHPAVIEAYNDGLLAGALEQCGGNRLAGPPASLQQEEVLVLALLEQRREVEPARRIA